MKNYRQNWILVLIVSLLTVFAMRAASADENPIESLQQTGKAFASIAKMVSPAVVNIQSDQAAGSNANGDSEEDLDGMDEDQLPPGLELFRNMDPRLQPFSMKRQPVIRQGSGFIIRQDGYIVTNNHLVQNAGKINVKLLDNKEYVAKVIGTDPQSDIAVIKIDAKDLPIVTLGNSDTVEVGEWVVALGNPFGLSHSLSAGILSAVGRNDVGIADYESFLQTDAAINPGNSGGPLLDLDGKVIGMNTAIFSRSGGYMGIGFAIPVNMVKSISEQLIASGTVVRGYLGVRIQEITKDLASSFGLKDRKGILVAQVETDSPANKAGLMQGDVIVQLDSKPVENTGDFRNSIAASKPGTKLALDVIRNNKPLKLQITVGNLNSSDAAAAPAKPEDQQAFAKLGISVQALTTDLAAKLGIKPDSGVIISKVKPGSIAEFSGLVRGALISEVNRKKVSSVKQFAEEVNKALQSNSVMFLIQDQYGSRYIVVNIG